MTTNGSRTGLRRPVELCFDPPIGLDTRVFREHDLCFMKARSHLDFADLHFGFAFVFGA